MSSIKKSFAGVMIAAFVFAGFATPAKAQTVAELQALVNQLMAQISAMSGSNTNTCTGSYVHTVTLKQGSMGSQVAAMQGVVGAIADGNFGPATKAKVATFQSQNGLVADGVVGPATGAKLAMAASANCGSNGNNDNDNNSGDLNGDFGTINDVNELSQYNNEEVGEGEEDVIVLGFEIEASNDGDIEIDNIRVSFDPTGNTGSDNLDDYASEVTVWFGDEKVGSADVEDFSQASDDTYSKTISLDNGVVVEGDETEKFYVAVSASNTFDSSDISGDSWTVDVESVRFVDGSGVVTTETGYDLDGMDVAVDFVSFSTSADTELKVSTDSDSPEAQVSIIDEEDTTDNVVLLKGKLKLEGTSDVVIDEFPVTLTTSGATDLDEITGSLTLIIDGEEYTESVSTSAATTTTVTFDNMDFDLAAGDTIEFTVKADVNDIETGLFEEGDMLKADVSSTNRTQMDVENEEGDALDTSSERSGTATGEYQEFRTEGIMVELVDTSASVTAGSSAFDDTGTFEIEFKVTAIGDAAYLGTTVTNGFTYTVDDSGTATTGGVSAVIVNNTDTDVTSQGNYLIEEGQSETFTLTVVRSGAPSDAGLYRATLTGVKWDSDDVNTVMANTYSSNMDDFHTSYVSLN